MKNGREANLTKQVEVLKKQSTVCTSVVLCSLLFVPCRASSNDVKRDISISKGMEVAQLPAEYVYYLLITEYYVKDQ